MNGVIHVFHDHLIFQGQRYRCAIGRNGMIDASLKREGDGKTPTGSYPIRRIFYRADRMTLPRVNFPTHIITKTDGWCDAPNHPQYNQHITLPFDASHETLWRDDHRYDIVGVLGHNDNPPQPNMGSCIFFHIAEENYAPTAGCVAVAMNDMLQLLEKLQLPAQMRMMDQVSE